MVSEESLHACFVDVADGGRTRGVDVERSWEVGEKGHFAEGLASAENAEREALPVEPDVASPNRARTHDSESTSSVAPRLNQLAVSITNEHFDLSQRGILVVAQQLEDPRYPVIESADGHAECR